ncbi:uncharacterized protein LOC106694286 [Microplitis demolitor]|uniref:uncharacterized protein LOC106694286 n=1 Tax=Microplitis demolitor TaxID=69319 RepID=UPI00235B6FBC|nr:uncharacterized protein LOC106694286 [Microplitis demolitor]XP_053593446.1 uncharacterized protein LOC106694286 [Microplitis demolitor]
MEKKLTASEKKRQTIINNEEYSYFWQKIDEKISNSDSKENINLLPLIKELSTLKKLEDSETNLVIEMMKNEKKLEETEKELNTDGKKKDNKKQKTKENEENLTVDDYYCIVNDNEHPELLVEQIKSVRRKLNEYDDTKIAFKVIDLPSNLVNSNEKELSFSENLKKESKYNYYIFENSNFTQTTPYVFVLKKEKNGIAKNGKGLEINIENEII